MTTSSYAEGWLGLINQSLPRFLDHFRCHPPLSPLASLASFKRHKFAIHLATPHRQGCLDTINLVRRWRWWSVCDFASREKEISIRSVGNSNSSPPLLSRFMPTVPIVWTLDSRLEYWRKGRGILAVAGSRLERYGDVRR